MAQFTQIGDKVRIVRDNECWDGMEGIVTQVGLKGSSFDGKDTLVYFEVTYKANHPSVKVGQIAETYLRLIDVIVPVFSRTGLDTP